LSQHLQCIMAKTRGLIQFTGTLDGISFYKSKYGWIARKKGGPDPKQMKTDKKFARVRENGKEFGVCGKAAGQVRRALVPLLKQSEDKEMTARLTKVFMAVKNLDMSSARGHRNIITGLQNADGKALLKGFEFNSKASVESLLKASYSVNVGNGTITVKHFVPKKHIKAPKGATHVALKSIVLRTDLLGKVAEVQVSVEKRLAMSSGERDVVLKPDVLSLTEGITFYLLQVCFYQELNGSDYHLKAAELNGMRLVELSPG